MTDSPVIRKVTRYAGVAGQFSVAAEVQYPDEPVRRVEFIGSTYGGPVVMRFECPPKGSTDETFISDPSRFGEFGPEWVRRFFAAS